jgi:transcriptional regulator with XRE-family HTH domain
MAALLRELRAKRGISVRQLPDSAGVRPSMARRAERGGDAKLSTWERLFDGLGYELRWDVQEIAEEVQDLLSEEAERRRERRLEGLCAGKRRFY